VDKTDSKYLRRLASLKR